MPVTAPDIFSLLPVLLALFISISLRNVIVGLFTGLFAGVLMIEGPALLGGVSLMVRDYLVPQVTDSYNAGVLVLLVFIGGFVALMERSGGGGAFAAKVARYITTKARLQISAWIGGVVIFFSDLGTPLIVGPTFRPMADHLRVSRAKLAYIIDSTASPVAILVPFIGWGVYIMSLLEQQFTALGIEQSDFQALVAALPFQFYAWLAVLAVPLLALTGVEFGPMARVERRAALEGLTPDEAANAALNAPPPGTSDKARASFIWLPLLVLFIVLLWTLVPLGFPFGRVSGADFRAGLSTAYLSAAVALILLMAFAGAQPLMTSVQVFLEGMSRMMLVAVMLLLAWAMGDMTTALGGGCLCRHAGGRERSTVGAAGDDLSCVLQHLLRHRLVMGNLCHHAPAGAAGYRRHRCAAVCVHRRGALGRTVRRPLLAHLRDHYFVVHRRGLRRLRTLPDPAALCAGQRGIVHRRLCAGGLHGLGVDAGAAYPAAGGWAAAVWHTAKVRLNRHALRS